MACDAQAGTSNETKASKRVNYYICPKCRAAVHYHKWPAIDPETGDHLGDYELFACPDCGEWWDSPAVVTTRYYYERAYNECRAMHKYKSFVFDQGGCHIIKRIPVHIRRAAARSFNARRYAQAGTSE